MKSYLMNFTVLSTLDYLKNYSGASSIAVAVVLVWKDEKRKTIGIRK